jgi:4a-hydroxytetrahydrobiopterin dehydratase
MVNKFNPDGLNAELLTVPSWKVVASGTAIKRKFIFPDFNTAFGFMVRSSLKAEEINHHPDWRNIFNVVEVVLTTHDTGNITNKDIQLARFMDSVFN